MHDRQKAFAEADRKWRELVTPANSQIGWRAFGLQGAGKPETPLRAAWIARLEAWDAMNEDRG